MWQNVPIHFFSTSGQTRLQTRAWKFTPHRPPPSLHLYIHAYGVNFSRTEILHCLETERRRGDFHAGMSIFFCIIADRDIFSHKKSRRGKFKRIPRTLSNIRLTCMEPLNLYASQTGDCYDDSHWPFAHLLVTVDETEQVFYQMVPDIGSNQDADLKEKLRHPVKRYQTPREAFSHATEYETFVTVMIPKTLKHFLPQPRAEKSLFQIFTVLHLWFFLPSTACTSLLEFRSLVRIPFFVLTLQM